MKQGDTSVMILLVLPGEETVELSIEDAKKLYGQLSEMFGARNAPAGPMISGPGSEPAPRVIDMVPPWPILPGSNWSTTAPQQPPGPPPIWCKEGADKPFPKEMDGTLNGSAITTIGKQEQPGELPPGCCYGEKQ